MRRKIAIALCVILGTMAFFGCSSAEIGYLNLNKEISGLTSLEFSGTTEIYWDGEVIKNFLAQTESGAYLLGDEEKALDKLTGKKAIQLTYKGTQQVLDEDVRYGVDLKAKVDGKEQKLGQLFASTSEGIYVERDLLMNLYLLSRDLLPEYKDSYFYSPDYEKELRKALGTSEYVELLNQEELAEDLPEGAYNPLPSDMVAIQETVLEGIQNIFKGYTSGAVSAVSGGYRISLSGDQLISIASGCLDYVSSNLDQVIDDSSKLLAAVEEWTGQEEGISGESLGKEDRLALAGQLAAAKGQLDYMNKSGRLDPFKPLTYTQTVTKSGNTYVIERNLSMDFQGKKMCSLKSKTSLTSKAVEVNMPVTGTPIGEITEKIDQMEASYNPVVQAEISWMKTRGGEEDDYWDDYDYCDVNYTRGQFSPFSSQKEYDWLEYKNIKKELYVPLRAIGEGLGQEIGWDNAGKTAYCLQNGQKIPLKGILDTDTVYVKVREFEKLGYQVKYDGSDPEFHVVTIKK